MNNLMTKMRFPQAFSIFFLISLFFSLIQKVNAFNLLTTKDSLRSLLVNTGDNEKKMQIWIQLSKISLQQEEDSARFFAQKAVSLFAQTHNDELYVDALNLLGQTHTLSGNVDSALAQHEKALYICQKMADKRRIATNWSHIGNVYSKQGRYNQALIAYLNALENVDSLQQSAECAYIFQRIAAVYRQQANPSKAIIYCEKAFKINKNLNISLAQAQILNEMGSAYYDLHEADKSLQHHLEAMNIFLKTHDNEGLAQCYASIAHLYFEDADYNKALEYAQKGVEIADKTQNLSIKSHTRMRLAEVYAVIQKYAKEAVSLLNEAMKIAQQANDKNQERIGHLIFAEMYKREKEFEKALSHTEKAQEIYEFLQKKNMGQELSDLHSTYELETQKQIAQESLKSFEENEKNDLLFRRFVATVSVLSFILFCVLIVAFYQKNKSEKKLADKNREISEQAAKLDTVVKERTRELEISQANVLAIMNNTKDSIWSVDNNLNIITLNKPLKDGFLGELGLSLKPNVNIKDIVPLEQYVFWKEKYERCLKGENYIFEFTFPKKSHDCTYEVSLNPIRDENNKIVGASTFCREITSRKQAEWEKTKLIQTLTQSNKDLEQFAYIVSHNLRAPIARMGGLMDIFNKDDASDPINKFVFENLAKGAKELDEITHDLNKIVAVRSNTQEKQTEISLSEVFENVQKSILHELDLVNATVTADFSAVDKIYAMKGYMYSIFQNFLTNSIKYKQQNKKLLVKTWTEKRGTCVYLYFEDNGLGIDLDKNRKKIFGLYNRFHPQIKGKGIGLHIIKAQVEIMNGKIDVKSIIGKTKCERTQNEM